MRACRRWNEDSRVQVQSIHISHGIKYRDKNPLSSQLGLGACRANEVSHHKNDNSLRGVVVKGYTTWKWRGWRWECVRGIWWQKSCMHARAECAHRLSTAKVRAPTQPPREGAEDHLEGKPAPSRLPSRVKEGWCACAYPPQGPGPAAGSWFTE